MVIFAVATPLLALGLFVAAPRPEVLHLTDGPDVAGRITNEDANEIVVATLDGPVRVPCRRVLARESTSRLRDLYRRTLPEAQEAGSRGLITLARWCLRKGLGSQLLDTLDRLLEIDPSNAAARRLVEALKRPGIDEFLGADAGLPPVTEEAGATGFPQLLRRFRPRGPARRCLMVERLARLHPTRERRQAAVEVVRHGRSSARLLATDLLGRWRTPEARPALLMAVVRDPAEAVRREAALTLRELGGPAAADWLSRVLGHPRSSYRAAAIDALATLGDARAVDALIANLGPLPAPPQPSASAPRNHIFVGRQVAMVTDFDVDIASNAAIADPIITTVIEGALLDVRVIGVSRRRSASERQRTVRALRQLTGAELGDDHVAWQLWWSAHRQQVLATHGVPARG